jgi:hypothetical protein
MTRLARIDEGTVSDQVPTREVHAAVERITASLEFRSAPRLIAFLRFIVERALAGDGVHLKGYTIAVEALGRRPDFDPQTDAIVRVEAGRLRRALARYYNGPGSSDSIVIAVPRGQYVPQIHRRWPVRGGPASGNDPKRELARERSVLEDRRLLIAECHYQVDLLRVSLASLGGEISAAQTAVIRSTQLVNALSATALNAHLETPTGLSADDRSLPPALESKV